MGNLATIPTVFPSGVLIAASLLLLSFLPAATLTAQKTNDDGPVGIFSSRSEYNAFMGAAKQAAYGPNGTPELRAMIPLLNDLALDQPIGSTSTQFKTSGGMLELLANDQVRADLEMIDAQYEELQRVQGEVQKRMAAQIRDLDFGNPAELVERIRNMHAQSQSELNAVLLPHQWGRLNQLRWQSQLRRRTLADLLTTDPLKSELEISSSQAADLQAAEKEIEADLAREIARLRAAARKKLILRLKPDQQSRVRDLLGDAFDFSTASATQSRAGAEAKQK